MRYTIITPTLARPTLVRLCHSLDSQTCTDWEHFVACDVVPNEEQQAILDAVRHPQRTVSCDPPQGYWGFPLRNQLWSKAHGDYILYTDDESYYVDDHVLDDLKVVTKDWAVFQLLYRGKPEPVLPLRVGRSDNNSIMVRRTSSIFPIYKVHEGDGLYIEQLQHDYPDFDVIDHRPLVVYT